MVILALGGFNENHLLSVVKRPHAAEAVENVQLLALSALALIGVGLLWRRCAPSLAGNDADQPKS